MSGQKAGYTGPTKPDTSGGGGRGPRWWQRLKAWLMWTVIVLVVALAAGMFIYDAVHDNMVDGPECTYWRFMTLRCL